MDWVVAGLVMFEVKGVNKEECGRSNNEERKNKMRMRRKDEKKGRGRRKNKMKMRRQEEERKEEEQRWSFMVTAPIRPRRPEKTHH